MSGRASKPKISSKSKNKYRLAGPTSRRPERHLGSAQAALSGLFGSEKKTDLIVPNCPSDKVTRCFKFDSHHAEAALPLLFLSALKMDGGPEVMRILGTALKTILELSNNPWGVTHSDAGSIDDINLSGTCIEGAAGTDIAFKKGTPDADGKDCVQISSDYPPIRIEALTSLIEVPMVEWAALLGVWFMTSVKTPTTENLTAFNERRVGLIKSLTTQPLKIFVAGSVFLDLTALSVPLTTFNMCMAHRIHLMRALIRLTRRTGNGPANAFSTLFRFTHGAGTAMFKMANIAWTKFPNLDYQFPLCIDEFDKIDEAAEEMSKWTPQEERGFLKAVYGGSITFLTPGEVPEAYGVFHIIASTLQPRYANLQGPKASTYHSARAAELIEKFKAIQDEALREADEASEEESSEEEEGSHDPRA